MGPSPTNSPFGSRWRPSSQRALTRTLAPIAFNRAASREARASSKLADRWLHTLRTNDSALGPRPAFCARAGTLGRRHLRGSYCPKAVTQVVSSALVVTAASPKEQPRRLRRTRCSLWAIALVRHRRRRVGSGRFLRRQRDRQLGDAPDDESDRARDARFPRKRRFEPVNGERLASEIAGLRLRQLSASGACPGFIKTRYSRSTVATTTRPTTAPVALLARTGTRAWPG
jgi:hypothetical protein